MNKKGIQLSINFVVVLIIAVVVFGMGLAFAYQLLGTANNMKSDLDRETNMQIEALLDEGLPVAIPLNRKTIRMGKTELLGLGINNRLGGTQTFRVTITSSAAFNEQKEDINPPEDGYWTFDQLDDIKIENNKYQKVPLAFHVQKYLDRAKTKPTVFGLYIFDVKVEYDDGGWKQYGNIQKIYIEVT